MTTTGAAPQVESFGRLADGTAVQAVSLHNRHGVSVRLISLGATVQSLRVPGRDGTVADIVLGCSDVSGYIDDPQFFGATIGRFGNRIGKGRFTLDGVEHQVPARDGPNALHGGANGYDKHVWEIARLSAPGEPGCVVFRRISPDGEEGFPGTLTVEASYRLDDDGLTLEYEATTDRPTVLNLTNHSYFNLAGVESGRSALDHVLWIDADAITPVDRTMIPTGEILPVEGTPFAFRTPTVIGSRIRDASDQQLAAGPGYDHNYVLRAGVTAQPEVAVRIEYPVSGRVLEIATTEPGVQFYSGNFLDGTTLGKGMQLYRQGDGLCFETQHFPDSPNHPHFPSTRLDPGQTFRSTTVWRFTTSGI